MTASLRIAFFVHEFPALSETFVLNQITGLIDLGHDVTIFAVRPRAESVVHEDVERYRLSERTHYLVMPENIPRRLVGGFASVLKNMHRCGSAILRSLNIRGYGRDAASLRMLYWTLCLREQKPFDIIHCHFGPIGQLVAKLRNAGAISGRLITVFHGVDVSAYVRDQPDYYRYLFADGDLFQPISRAWSRRLIELGCDAARIDVHHMGIDTDRYPFRPRQFRGDGPLRVLTVGRMVEKKGIEYGLSAIAKLIGRGIDVRYTIIGDGPLRADLERQVDALDIRSNVTFCGWQDQDAVARQMDEHDVLLAPSVTSPDGDQEGIPVTLMEGMASGMIVVSTQHSGIPELVQDGRSGFLVAERDADALGDILTQLTQLPGLWSGLSTAAREAVCHEFEITTLNQALIRRYLALLEQGPPRKKRPMFIARRRFATN